MRLSFSLFFKLFELFKWLNDTNIIDNFLRKFNFVSMITKFTISNSFYPFLELFLFYDIENELKCGIEPHWKRMKCFWNYIFSPLEAWSKIYSKLSVEQTEQWHKMKGNISFSLDRISIECRRTQKRHKELIHRPNEYANWMMNMVFDIRKRTKEIV